MKNKKSNSILAHWKIQKAKKMFQEGNRLILYRFGYWQMVQEVWSEYLELDPTFLENGGNKIPTEATFITNYTPMEKIDFLSFIVSSIIHKKEHKKSIEFEHFLTAISSLASSPSTLRNTLCMTKEEKRIKFEEEKERQWMEEHRTIKLVDFNGTLRGQNESPNEEKEKYPIVQPEWNYEPLPAPPARENENWQHHRDGAHSKPNETIPIIISGDALITMKESIQQEYEYNKTENGETHLSKQLGGYDGVSEPEVRLQTMRENLEYRLSIDISIHRWKHIWVKISFKSFLFLFFFFFFY